MVPEADLFSLNLSNHVERRSSRSRSQAKMTGVTTRMWMREESMPPTTGAASDVADSDGDAEVETRKPLEEHATDEGEGDGQNHVGGHGGGSVGRADGKRGNKIAALQAWILGSGAKGIGWPQRGAESAKNSARTWGSG